MKVIKLDNATSGMRRAQWNTETLRNQPKADARLKKSSPPRPQTQENQRSETKERRRQDQRKLCASAWAALRQEDAFRTALTRLEQGHSLNEVLRDTLRVHNAFLRMLVARDLAVLLPEYVSKENVEECTVVGEPAEAILVECTTGPADGSYDKDGVWRYSSTCRKTFPERLRRLHEELVKLLDPKLLELVVPQGWTLDLTENACCELRRWDHARRKRRRGCMAEQTKRQQKRLEQLRATWQELGFTSMPLCGLCHEHSA